MREEEKELNWFSRWEEELPRPEELMPLSQTLITPDLAIAFDIPTNTDATPNDKSNNQDTNISSPPLSTTLKKPRLVWTPQLHKRFVEAVAHLGIKNAVPKTIMQLMNVDGLTRENVASHLQKYRLYLKRMQHSSSSSFVGDAASDRLFATAPVPSQFLRAPFAPVAAMQHYRPMPAAAAVSQNQYYIQNHMGMMTVPPNPGMNRMPMFRPPPPPTPPSYLEELDSAKRMGRRVLSLFPDGED